MAREVIKSLVSHCCCIRFVFGLVFTVTSSSNLTPPGPACCLYSDPCLAAPASLDAFLKPLILGTCTPRHRYLSHGCAIPPPFDFDSNSVRAYVTHIHQLSIQGCPRPLLIGTHTTPTPSLLSYSMLAKKSFLLLRRKKGP